MTTSTSLPSRAAKTVVVIAAFIFFATPGRAEIDYPWCSLSSTGQSGTPFCRFTTLEQCQASVAGSGWCQRNSRLVWQEQQAKQRGSR